MKMYHVLQINHVLVTLYRLKKCENYLGKPSSIWKRPIYNSNFNFELYKAHLEHKLAMPSVQYGTLHWSRTSVKVNAVLYTKITSAWVGEKGPSSACNTGRHD